MKIIVSCRLTHFVERITGSLFSNWIHFYISWIKIYDVFGAFSSCKQDAKMFATDDVS